jgi:hypothetical protein
VALDPSAAWTQAGAFTAAGLPYVVEGPDLVLDSAGPVVLEPGAAFKVAPGAALRARALSSAATSAQPATLTSLLDDSVAGDTNLDGGATSADRGDWSGIAITAGGAADLAGLVVRHSATGVSADAATVSLRDSTISANLTGIAYSNGATGTVTDTAVFGHDVGLDVDATSAPVLGDLSDADPSNDGGNAFTCNLLHVRNLGPELKAEGSWWGAAPPLEPLLAGAIDLDPYLDRSTGPDPVDLRVRGDAAAGDVLLDWLDAVVPCGFRVLRSDRPDGGFADVSGRLTASDFADAGALRDGATWFYVVVAE